jgi:hypothetical protein
MKKDYSKFKGLKISVSENLNSNQYPLKRMVDELHDHNKLNSPELNSS